MDTAQELLETYTVDVCAVPGDLGKQLQCRADMTTVRLCSSQIRADILDRCDRRDQRQP